MRCDDELYLGMLCVHNGSVLLRLPPLATITRVARNEFINMRHGLQRREGDIRCPVENGYHRPGLALISHTDINLTVLENLHSVKRGGGESICRHNAL